MNVADLFDEATRRSKTPIRSSSARSISTSSNAFCPRSRSRSSSRDPRMVFCAAVDRNGYLPVHNKIYSQPQRPGDVAWNTANCRNRRIFNDPRPRRAQNKRTYLIQSYPRDMGNGQTIMMREIDVPITSTAATGADSGRRISSEPSFRGRL